jgi:hypothetical protein
MTKRPPNWHGNELSISSTRICASLSRCESLMAWDTTPCADGLGGTSCRPLPHSWGVWLKVDYGG